MWPTTHCACRRLAQLTDQLGYLTETTLRKLAGIGRYSLAMWHSCGFGAPYSQAMSSQHCSAEGHRYNNQLTVVPVQTDITSSQLLLELEMGHIAAGSCRVPVTGSVIASHASYLSLDAADRFGQLAVEQKHIFSIHSLASLLLTPDVLVTYALCSLHALLMV